MWINVKNSTIVRVKWSVIYRRFFSTVEYSKCLHMAHDAQIITHWSISLYSAIITCLRAILDALRTHPFDHGQLQCRVAVFLVRCVQIGLLTYLLISFLFRELHFLCSYCVCSRASHLKTAGELKIALAGTARRSMRERCTSIIDSNTDKPGLRAYPPAIKWLLSAMLLSPTKWN